MEFYFAIFRQTEDTVSAFFPDLGIPEVRCANWDEAYENTVAALAEWLVEKEATYISEPSTYDEIRQKNQGSGEIIPVPVDREIVKNHQITKRFSVVFPESILQKVDIYRLKKGVRRSALLLDAVIDYMKNKK
ncbi:MAG: type II toxin-antitoxin system HicB family antitoxin [SAR324 cluster bacterium]|nr:type II toxin-antitoxin system HicB family antitoxin [SAR324 cluster bacterium]